MIDSCGKLAMHVVFKESESNRDFVNPVSLGFGLFN